MEYRGYLPVIGIEIHVQLQTRSKLFASDPNQFDAGDNENTSPITIGMPGTLPVINKKAVEHAIKAGLALGCSIRKKSVFARKNYFYPDLPKGYQISQYDQPICENGHIEFSVGEVIKKVSITRAHLEEDAGKSIHQGDATLINYNRSGIPLLEIVSGPEMHSAEEAAEYCRTIRQIVRYLEVCDGNLEEGSLRCDINISVKKPDQKNFGTKVELKNLNSFRFIEKAVEYEIDRQIDALERGEVISQETRLWDPDKNRTFMMRAKEDAQDYRYFPDPDLLVLKVEEQLIQSVQSQLPELPQARASRFIQNLGLTKEDAKILTAEKEIADYFEKAAVLSKNPKASANWIMSELLRELKTSQKHISEAPVTPEKLAKLISLIDQNVISGKIGKTVFTEMWATGAEPEDVIKTKGLVQVSDPTELTKIISEILKSNPDQVIEFRSGKTKVLGFFVGLIMKATRGQANPDLVNQILSKLLKGDHG